MFIILLLRFIWELPQNILGVLMWFFSCMVIKKSSQDKETGSMLFGVPGFGISLGLFVFYPLAGSYGPEYDLQDEQVTKMHEFGHSIQSLMLGPLYLLIVGIPSISMNILTRMGILRPENYYKRFPENWADKIAGIKRLD